MSDKEFGLTNEGTDGVVPVPVETKEPTLVPVEKKKRGRPSKKHIGVDPAKEDCDSTVKAWYCSTCKEYFDDKNVMKIAAGDNRWAVFCNVCQRSFGFQDQDMLDKVANLVRDNPTGK